MGRSLPTLWKRESETNRIYVTNDVSNNVNVIDGESNQVVDSISAGDNPAGVSVNSTTNRIYVLNFDSDNVSVIDGENNLVIDTIPVGDKPLNTCGIP